VTASVTYRRVLGPAILARSALRYGRTPEIRDYALGLRPGEGILTTHRFPPALLALRALVLNSIRALVAVRAEG
jgi:hypothetical protein